MQMQQIMLLQPICTMSIRQLFATTTTIRSISTTRHSGIQKEVLALYRKVLRVAFAKDRDNNKNSIRLQFCHLLQTSKIDNDYVGDSTRLDDNSSKSSIKLKSIADNVSSNNSIDPTKNTTTTTLYAAHEFRKQASSVQRNEYKKIEYMIRKGEKHIKLLQMPGTVKVGSSSNN